MHWTKKEEVNPSDALIASHPDVFEAFRPDSRRAEFNEFRADLRALLSPFGGAVNNGNARSSYNATHVRHLTKDFADNSVGLFLYHLAVADLGSGSSPIVDLIRDVLADPTEEIATLCAPLLQPQECDEFALTEGTYPAGSVFAVRRGQFTSRIVSGVRHGLDHLAAFERTHGMGRETLRRVVAFGVFGMLLHMANRHREMAAGSGLIPHLLYFHDRYRTTVYQASHYTYALARQSIENLYTDRFRARIVDRIGQRPTAKKCADFLDTVTFKKSRNEGAIRTQLKRAFAVYEGQLGAVDALAEAIRDALFRDLSGTPLDFYRGIGVRIGFLRPTGNSATRKYYTLDGVLMEAVLASILPEESMTFRELLDVMWARYGVMVGGRPEDAGILLAEGIGQATVEDLRSNAHVFRHYLIALGWARQYADGVLVVHIPKGVQ
jgi:hypothetical protein